MTHSEKRAAWYTEGLIAFGTGITYGATNALVGHPADTVKAKMQVQTGFVKGADAGMMGVVKRVWRTEGPVGFFRGVVPPLLGSSVYRSAQFAVFEAVFTRMQELGVDKATIPGSGGLAEAFPSAVVPMVVSLEGEDGYPSTGASLAWSSVERPSEGFWQVQIRAVRIGNHTLDYCSGAGGAGSTSRGAWLAFSPARSQAP